MELPSTVEQVQHVVASSRRVAIIGGGTKSALSRDATFSTAGLKGVLEYEPSEFTFTARAGTPAADVVAMLAGHRQQLPFDPPLVEAGATLGGTVSAGLSGPGRYRYGGLRDFLLGVRVVTGEGQVVGGGGKVVKNAAGFDIPKLMIGSLGSLGVLVELTFKVFPQAEASATACVQLQDLDSAVEWLAHLAVSPLDLACLDLQPPNRLLVRIAGLAEALDRRCERLREFVAAEVEILDGSTDAALWRDAREFRWAPADHSLVKLPLSPPQIPEAERWLEQTGNPVPRRYSVGGHVLWLAWPPSLTPQQLDELCRTLGRRALAVTGRWPQPLIGPRADDAFEQRLLQVFDPDAKFSRDTAA